MATKYQRVGLHVSAAGGVENAPLRAHEDFDAECFQFFSRSPRGGAASPISDGQAKQFRETCEQYGYESYIHTPYYINFASPKKSLAAASTRIVQEELQRGSLLGVKYVVTHMGSEKNWPEAEQGKIPNQALKQAAANIKAIYSGKKFTSTLLLEISAGAGNVIGNRFEELAYLLKAAGRSDIHVCLDTCHLFASGYDLRTKQALDETMKQFKAVIGLAEFKLAHVNDSKAELGGRVDRHEHIGKGKIGEAGFKALLRHPDFQKVNFILETEHDKPIYDDLEFLKKHRKVK